MVAFRTLLIVIKVDVSDDAYCIDDLRRLRRAFWPSDGPTLRWSNSLTNEWSGPCYIHDAPFAARTSSMFLRHYWPSCLNPVLQPFTLLDARTSIFHRRLLSPSTSKQLTRSILYDGVTSVCSPHIYYYSSQAYTHAYWCHRWSGGNTHSFYFQIIPKLTKGKIILRFVLVCLYNVYLHPLRKCRFLLVLEEVYFINPCR